MESGHKSIIILCSTIYRRLRMLNTSAICTQKVNICTHFRGTKQTRHTWCETNQSQIEHHPIISQTAIKTWANKSRKKETTTSTYKCMMENVKINIVRWLQRTTELEASSAASSQQPASPRKAEEESKKKKLAALTVSADERMKAAAVLAAAKKCTAKWKQTEEIAYNRRPYRLTHTSRASKNWNSVKIQQHIHAIEWIFSIYI